MPNWIFVRHGESRANLDGVYSGHGDSPLTEHGRQQARRIAAHVARLRPRRAFCSDLSRAHDTARLILEGSAIPLTATDRLRERDVGTLTWTAIADARRTEVGARLRTWRGRPPGGESVEDAALRGLTFLASVDDDLDTLVVAHGTLVRGVLAVADGLAPGELSEHRLRNCEVVTRQWAVGHWARSLRRARDAAAAPGAKSG